jgi:hypothetical protein
MIWSEPKFRNAVLQNFRLWLDIYENLYIDIYQGLKQGIGGFNNI